MDPNSVDILLMEDNSTDPERAIRELRKHHMANNLYHLKNGEEALNFIFATGKYASNRKIENSPKVVLLDIQMPKVSRIEVLSKLKSDHRTRAIPVLILTSFRENPDVQKYYDLGTNRYIVKPVHFEGFAEAIRNLGLYWLLLNQTPL